MKKMNIVIYTNILTPYRVYFFDNLFIECKKENIDFHVIVMAETELGRTWQYQDLRTEYTILLRSKTFSRGQMHIHYNSNLESVLSKLDPDVLVCAGSYLCPGIWKALRMKTKRNFKMIFWSESHLNESRNFGGFKAKIREIIRKKIYKKFDGFWYAGKLSRELIETYCSPSARLMFMPNLVEERVYKQAKNFSEEYKRKIRKKYGLDDKKCIFICPARLIPVKGIDRFIPLFSQTKHHSKATVLIAGDGEQKKIILELIEDYCVDVRLIGHKEQKDIVELYSISDYLVLPSISDANPLTCIEALWAGLPLFISENCGNYLEVIHQGINGYSFSYDNVDNAVGKLDELILANFDWKNKAKRESLFIAEEKYNTKEVVERIIRELREII